MVELTDDIFIDYIAEHPLVLVDFWSLTCAPCLRMKKIMPRLEKELNSIAAVAMIEEQVSAEMRSMYDIDKIPTFLIFKDGQEVGRLIGIFTLDSLKDAVVSVA